ncbi:MAG: CAP domain-containing protein [Mogibacterium sp.]|nr:CAP domain-containing protein [Mogibacterium sp.]MBR0340853.1 CAP domain-containing protein [Oscillospiraceae bacterium]
MQRAAEIALLYSHTRPSGEASFTAFSEVEGAGEPGGENIAAAYGYSAEEMLDAWWEEDEDYSGQGHRRNILNSDNRYVGIGHVNVGGTDFWVQEFSSTGGSAKATEANNSPTVFTITAKGEDIYLDNMNSYVSSIDIKSGETTSLPEFTEEVRHKNSTIDFATPVVNTSDWVIADTTIAEIRDGKILGKAIGTTTLKREAMYGGDPLKIMINVAEKSEEPAKPGAVDDSDKYSEDTNPVNPSGYQQSDNEEGPVIDTYSDSREDYAPDGTAVGKGASAETAEYAIKNLSSDSDPSGAKFAPLMLKSTKQTKTSIKLSWKKVKGAKKYVIYGNRCGTSNKPKKLATVKGYSKTIKKIASKKLKKGKYYKFIVVALDSNKRVVSTSRIIHTATKGGKARNYTRVTTKAKKNKVSLKKGKTFKLGAKAVGKNVKKHVCLRYESSDAKVAKVNKSGKITAKKKGTCKIYVYAQNGVCKVINVTVK